MIGVLLLLILVWFYSNLILLCILVVFFVVEKFKVVYVVKCCFVMILRDLVDDRDFRVGILLGIWNKICLVKILVD